MDPDLPPDVIKLVAAGSEDHSEVANTTGNSKSVAGNKRDFEKETLSQNKLDPKCIVEINKRFVRIEYPGEVKNIDKAIETLGGIEGIEFSVADHNHKLVLHFHPGNKYNKPCYADKDFKPGLLIKVKKKLPEEEEEEETSSLKENVLYEYYIEGVSVINFSFNRLCDFQYLPLIAKQTETKSSKTEYIYEKVLPVHLPTLNWLESEDARNMGQFLLPVRFSHYDGSHKKLNVESERNEPKLKLKTVSKTNPKQQKSVCKIFGKVRQQHSVFMNFNDPDVPTQPLESAVALMKHRNLEEKVRGVKQLFDERPIWTKAAIRYNTGLSDEHCKVILPVVAYYFTNGPWRITWVKFGYDPRRDPKARIYQTLDYRIKTAENTKLKVSAKRSYAGKASSFLGPSHVKKITLKSDMSSRPKAELDERYYVLRPHTLPPARQMFYQLCDLLLPEVQEMVSRLPKASGSFCHPKNGWLPDNFIERGRQVVNEHVVEAVQRELLQDRKILEEKESREKERKKGRNGGSHLDYYNQMLINVKKGVHRNVATRQFPSETDLSELICLSSDDDEEEFTVGEIIQNSIPEKLDDEDQDDSDAADIDMEAVREINELISQVNVKE